MEGRPFTSGRRNWRNGNELADVVERERRVGGVRDEQVLSLTICFLPLFDLFKPKFKFVSKRIYTFLTSEWRMGTDEIKI